MTAYDPDGEPADPAYATVEVGDLRLNGQKLVRHLTDLVTDVQVELSIEEPSTATIACHDPGRLLLASGALDEAVDVSIGKHAFRLVRVDKAGDAFTLTMEDRDVARLRLNTKSKKATRGKVTRAQFLKSMVDETAGIKFWAPDLGRVQPTLAPDEKVGSKISGSRTKASASKSSREPGFAPKSSLRGLQGPLGPDQVRNLALCLKVARQLKAGPKATLAMVEAGLVEAPDFRNSGTATDHTSTGVFQLLSSTARGLGVSATDVEACARLFLTKGFYGRGGAIALAKTGRSAGIVAADVEGPAAQYRGRYDQARDTAVKLIEAFTGEDVSNFEAGGSGSGSDSRSVTTTSLKPYEFTRGTDQGSESTWDAARRLADEVQRRFFIVDREAIFAFDRDLMQQQPVARIAEYEDGVDIIDWSRDTGKRIETATVACRGDAWLARPGDVIVTEDQGDASGRWLVSRISGPLSSISRTIELTRPMKGLREPSAETVTKTTTISAGQARGGGGGGGSGGDGARGPKNGKWTYGAGVPHTLDAKMRSFLDRMVTYYDKTLIATTTTNHSYLTSSGNVSNHNGGGAADFGSVANWGGEYGGRGGYRIAIAAHRACGASYNEAVKRASTPNYTRWKCKEGTVQILWRVEGHFDHVHVGTG